MADQTPSDDSLAPHGSGSPPGPPPPPFDDPFVPQLADEHAAAAAPVPSGRTRPLLFGLAAALAVGGVAAGVLVVSSGGSSNDSETVRADAPESDEVAPTVAGSPSTAATATTSAPLTTESASTTVASTTMASTTVASTTVATTTVATTAAPTTAAATIQAESTHPTLPNGSPAPIIAIYDGPVVRVTGWVPDEDKALQLEALALANSTDPNAQIEANWSFDPSVPLNIGTRVIEMNSPRFPPGSSEVTPEHAEQLNRVAGVLNLLPNVTAMVVGHADQVGDANANFLLSEARAVSVVRYLVSQGVDPSRLSSRAVGEQDLLSDDESAASLALNRRTEFIFYGLLAD